MNPYIRIFGGLTTAHLSDHLERAKRLKLTNDPEKSSLDQAPTPADGNKKSMSPDIQMKSK
jgi:hypothetical protein